MFRPQEQTPGNPRYDDDDGKDGDYVKSSDDDRDNGYEEGDMGTFAKKRRASFLQAKGTNAKGKSSAKLLTRKLRMAIPKGSNYIYTILLYHLWYPLQEPFGELSPIRRYIRKHLEDICNRLSSMLAQHHLSIP